MRNLLFSFTYSVLAVALTLVVFNGTAKADHKDGHPPSGWCYNLQLIGVDKPKNDNTIDDWGGNGHRIFIKLNGHTKILLSEGDFAVLDANGTDGTARFQLPANPCVDPDTGEVLDECPVNDPSFQCYSVWVREVGRPCIPVDLDGDGDADGCASITTCATEIGICDEALMQCINDLAFGDFCDSDEDCDRFVCSSESVILVRDRGKPHWDNVTKELTTVCIDLDGNGTCDERVPLFDPDFKDFTWWVDNHGLQHAQLRFCPEEGDVCDLHPNKKNR